MVFALHLVCGHAMSAPPASLTENTKSQRFIFVGHVKVFRKPQLKKKVGLENFCFVIFFETNTNIDICMCALPLPPPISYTLTHNN